MQEFESSNLKQVLCFNLWAFVCEYALIGQK